MYNPEPVSVYNAYLVNLAHTLGAHVHQQTGRHPRINLREGKRIKKIQINVTTKDQSKFRLTKDGHGFGYGFDKISPEDAFLASVLEKASENVRHKKRVKGQRKNLAEIVPALPKKPPKPVDEKQALILSCRRNKLIDKNGVLMQR